MWVIELGIFPRSAAARWCSALVKGPLPPRSARPSVVSLHPRWGTYTTCAAPPPPDYYATATAPESFSAPLGSGFSGCSGRIAPGLKFCAWAGIAPDPEQPSQGHLWLLEFLVGRLNRRNGHHERLQFAAVENP